MYYIGIDIGSTCAKTVVLGQTDAPLYTAAQPTGWSCWTPPQTLPEG